MTAAGVINDRIYGIQVSGGTANYSGFLMMHSDLKTHRPVGRTNLIDLSEPF